MLVHIKPTRPEIKVRDPVTGRPLPLEGENKVRTPWWLRRQREGDVTITPAKRPRKRKPAPAEEK